MAAGDNEIDLLLARGLPGVHPRAPEGGPRPLVCRQAVNLAQAVGDIHEPVIRGVVLRTEVEELAHLSAVTNLDDDPLIPDAVDGNDLHSAA
jgi:hypothetical protein